MNVKNMAQQQYRSLANRAASQSNLQLPPEGWLRTVRMALGMSGPQLAKKMGVTRARVTQAEHNELTGAATLKSMQTAAEAMGCKFVYAVVPETTIENLIAFAGPKKSFGARENRQHAYGSRKPELA